MRAPVDTIATSSRSRVRAHGRRAIAAGAAAILAAGILAEAPTAHADRHPTHDGIVLDDPADQTPDVLDGHVNAFAQVGPTMIVGGSFGKVRVGDTTFRRHNIFAFDVNTGQVSTTFRPYAHGEVFDLQVSRNKAAVYVAGAFTSIGDAKKTGRIARVAIADGAVDKRFTSPGINGTVRDIGYALGRYYLTGDFTKVAHKPRAYLVALNAKGRDTGRAKVSFTGTNRDGRTQVRAMDIAPNGTTMAVAGNFMRVNGKRRPQLAVLHLGKRATTLTKWSTDRFAPQCGPHFDSYMRDVAFSPTGTFFVVTTTGGPKGVQSSGLLCDTVSRWNLGGGAGHQPAWVDYTGGDTLTAVIVDRNVVYVGGHQRWFNNSFGRNHARQGAVERPGIAALDPLNGLPYQWNPTRPRGYGVSGFALTKAGLWVGHDTPKFGGEPHLRIAFCPNDDVYQLPANATASLPGTLTRLGRGATNAVVTRSYDGTATANPQTLPDDGTVWQDVRGSFVVDGVLYTGWADGTMRAQTYDGSTFGAPEAVDLHGAFRDLPNVRTMFFDRGTHRVYYTLDGSTKLFYRYFTPESRVVGAWRYTVKASSPVSWDRLGGAFIVGKRLHYVDDPTGSLRVVGWNHAGGRAFGSPRVVLGPAIDHVNYRARGLVLTQP